MMAACASGVRRVKIASVGPLRVNRGGLTGKGSVADACSCLETLPMSTARSAVKA